MTGEYWMEQRERPHPVLDVSSEHSQVAFCRNPEGVNDVHFRNVP